MGLPQPPKGLFYVRLPGSLRDQETLVLLREAVQSSGAGLAFVDSITVGTPGSDVTPFGVWSGECTGPYVITFKQKTHYIDLTGTARIL